MSHNVYLVLVRRFDHCHALRHAVLVLLWLEFELLQAWRLEALQRIPLLWVPTWLVSDLVLLHHLTTRTLSFLAAVIYYRISKTNSVLISLKSNKFPCLSFTEMVKLFAYFLGNIQICCFFFLSLFVLYVTLLNGLPLTGWLTGTADCLTFKKYFCLSTRTKLIICLRILQFFQIQWRKRKIRTQKHLANQRLQRICPFNALLILVAPKLVFAVANAFFEPEFLKNSISSFYHFFIAVEGRSKISLSLFFFWIVNLIAYYYLLFFFNELDDFQSEQETKPTKYATVVVSCLHAKPCEDFPLRWLLQTP